MTNSIEDRLSRHAMDMYVRGEVASLKYARDITDESFRITGDLSRLPKNLDEYNELLHGKHPSKTALFSVKREMNKLYKRWIARKIKKRRGKL